MGRSSDILIGLNAGTSAIRAAAFDLTGRELGFATLPNHWVRVGQSGAEQDLAETWQLAAGAIRRLADGVPDLARRTVALAVTGQIDGTWLIDEDGDPIAPAMLWLDRRAGPMLDAWRAAGAASAVAQVTGTALCPAQQSVQMAWLLQHRREVVEQAAHALHCKDWLYHCCTGERVTDPAEAARTDRRVFDLLGIEDALRLLPDVIDGRRCHHRLTLPAAAATRLWQGTPVVLGPPEPLAAALGAGVVAADRDVACTVFGTADIHARARPSAEVRAWPPQPGVATVPLPVPDTCARMMAGMGTATATEWLVGLGDELLADAGLIGLSRTDLVALLERKAAQAAPGRALFLPSTARGSAPDTLVDLAGIGPETGLGEIVRAVYEGGAFAARACHATLGALPDELRIAGRGSASPTFRRILSAALGRSVRASQRRDPATAGAALFAAVALGHHAGVDDASAVWVEPWHGEPEPLDDELQARYARLSETYSATGARLAGSDRDRDDPG